MTQEANKLKRKQDLKKYLVFALMFAVFAGSLWLIFAPSEKEREGAGAIGRVQHRTARSPQCRDCRGQEDGLRAGYDAAQAGGEDAHTRRTIFRYGKTGQHGTAVRAG